MRDLLCGSRINFHVFHGDCVEGMKSLDAGLVDIVVTSPPYNLGKDYGRYDDNRDPVEYLEWCQEWGGQIARLLKSDGSYFLNVGSTSTNPWLPFEVAQVMVDCGFVLQNTIHWIKSVSIDRGDETTSYGHFKPINSRRLVNDCHEYVFHLTKTGKTELDRLGVGVPYADKSNIARWGHTNGNDRRCRGNVWFVPYKTINRRAKERPHPATFPAELAEKCVRLHGKQGSVVMDPFLGIGHAALGAINCGELVSEFIGFDIDEEYLKVASQVIGCTYGPIPQRTAGRHHQLAA